MVSSPPLVFYFLLLSLFLLYSPTHSTIDVNFVEYQYIADHLTKEECNKLFAALHFRGFDLPKEINAAVRRLPVDVPCIDLLLHWNSAPREGKSQTHVDVCHRLNQIGREDLSEWLSKNVFHQICKDLKTTLESSESEPTFSRQLNITDICKSEEVKDEEGWGKFDTILTILILTGFVTFIFGSFFACFLYCTRNTKVLRQGYNKLPTREK